MTDKPSMERMQFWANHNKENIMKVRKFLNIAVSLLVLSGLLFGNTPSMVRAENAAMPMDPMDETKVPHYFGPNPNWANSPFTLPDVQVIITGNGTGATAEATVGANGAHHWHHHHQSGIRLFECKGRYRALISHWNRVWRNGRCDHRQEGIGRRCHGGYTRHRLHSAYRDLQWR